MKGGDSLRKIKTNFIDDLDELRKVLNTKKGASLISCQIKLSQLVTINKILQVSFKILPKDS